MENELAYTATEDVRSALASVGRTEDVTFSPDGRRLAIVGFGQGRCLLVDIDLDFAAGRKKIALSDAVEFTSPEISEPHGLAFLDSETLLVGNRGGDVKAFRVPPRISDGGRHSVVLEAERVEGDAEMHALKSPGSVAVIPVGDRRYDILVCRNYSKRVTRHRLDARAGLRVTKNRVLIRQGMKIPDGVSVSPSNRWIAISNHGTWTVLIFRNAWHLNRWWSRPVGELRGTTYPHGVRFTADGRFILVAAAGSPDVNIYAASGDDWRGERDPTATLRVMNWPTFLRGHANAEEGGPKGIDVDRGMNVLVATSEHQPLAFFDLAAVLPRV